MTAKIEIRLPLSPETVELFEHAFGAEAPIIAKAAAPPKRKPRKSH